MLKFLIIDDHPLVRVSMAALFSQHFVGVECVESHSFEQTVGVFKHGCPDLIFMDLSLPGVHGIVAIRNILQLYPQARIIVISGSTKRLDKQRSFEAGAQGYLSKADNTQTMIDTIQQVLNAECDAATVQKMKQEKLLEGQYLEEILQLIAVGETNKAIAGLLGISEVAVKGKCRMIYQKLGVNNRTQAVREGSRLGLLE